MKIEAGNDEKQGATDYDLRRKGREGNRERYREPRSRKTEKSRIAERERERERICFFSVLGLFCVLMVACCCGRQRELFEEEEEKRKKEDRRRRETGD